MSENTEPRDPKFFLVDLDDPKADQLPNKDSPEKNASNLKSQVFEIDVVASSCASWGPLEVCAKYRKGGIDVDIKLLGQRIGGGRLDKDNLKLAVGVDLGAAKCGVSLKANFGDKKLVAKGQVCVRDWQWNWQCEKFEDTILKW